MWGRALRLRPVPQLWPDGLCDAARGPYIATMNDLAIKVVLEAAHIGETDQYCRTLADLGMTVKAAFPKSA
jgi:hypothetical protein